MRTIKFRAWNISFGMKEVSGWIYETLYIKNDGGLGYEPMTRDKWEVMQFTGLRDKNGKEIYEGDQIRYWEDQDVEQDEEGNDYVPENCVYEMVVEWNENNSGYFFDEPMGFDYYPPLGSSDVTIEVVGNIYEDSHLLAEKKKEAGL